MFTCNFEKLEIQYSDLVYKITREFPEHERFGLTNQMRRAAVSISSNIAEGSSLSSRADFARFVEIATGSLFEVLSQARIFSESAIRSSRCLCPDLHGGGETEPDA